MPISQDCRARYYNPATGRFLSEDPLGFAGSGPNLYAYAGDSPTNATDPSGEVPDFAIPGYNWCGPGWTGGHWEQYDPSHNTHTTTWGIVPVTINGASGSMLGGTTQTSYYLAPVNDLDEACEVHDKCYYSCRANNKCDKTARKNCMTQCNQALGQGAANSGVSGLVEWGIEQYMKNNGPSDDLVGPNDPSCRCKK